MSLYTLFIVMHVIGTVLGAGGSTIAEVQINKALKDKQVSPDERALMHGTYFIIRVGIAIILLSAVGIIWHHLSEGTGSMVFNDKVWIKELMVVVIVANAVAISRRWVPLWLGASVSFTSWWGATILGAAGYLPYSFLTYLVTYVIAIFVMAGILHLIRSHMHKQQ